MTPCNVNTRERERESERSHVLCKTQSIACFIVLFPTSHTLVRLHIPRTSLPSLQKKELASGGKKSERGKRIWVYPWTDDGYGSSTGPNSNLLNSGPWSVYTVCSVLSWFKTPPTTCWGYRVWDHHDSVYSRKRKVDLGSHEWELPTNKHVMSRESVVKREINRTV